MRSDGLPEFLITTVCGLLIAMPLAAVVHEAGHALAALVAGRNLIAVVVGQGRKLASLRIGPTQLVLRRKPSSGYVVYDASGASVWGERIVTLAGAAANVAAAIFVCWMGFAVFRERSSLISGSVLLAFFQLATAAVALIPKTMVQHYTGVSESDGAKLAKSFSNPSFKSASWDDWARERLAAYEVPGRPTVFSQRDRQFLTELLHDFRESTTEGMRRVVLERGTERLGLAPAIELFLIDGIVTQGLAELTPEETDRLTARAMAIGAHSRNIRQTRASALINCGRYEEGKALFATTADQPNSPFEEALTRFFLVKAEAGLGNWDAAEEHFNALKKFENTQGGAPLVEAAAKMMMAGE